MFGRKHRKIGVALTVSDEGHDTDVVAAAKALKAATRFPGPVAAMVAVRHADSKWGLKQTGTF